MWRAEDPECNEAAKVKWDIVQYTRGRVLDLGCGPSKPFAHFLGLDNKKDTELFGTEMQPTLVADAERLSDTIQAESVDAIFSSHLLEHILDYKAALAEWWAAIKVGGYLVLYLPHRDLYPNVGQPLANPDHKHDFIPDDIEAALIEHGFGFDCMVNEVRSEGREYSFLYVAKKRGDATVTWPCQDPKPEKTACVVRYGGFGDMLQAANILPALKRAGFHVTVMTTPRGQNIIKNDPHVDAWFIQDDDQVLNAELGEYWTHHMKRFDRFVNLSESVEGTLLAIPGRYNHTWSDMARRRIMGTVDYLEFVATLAEVDFAPEARFYPTLGESGLACGLLTTMRMRLAGYSEGQRPKGPVNLPQAFHCMLVLAGSSIHKVWPHMDDMMRAVLTRIPNAVFYLVGDNDCQMLEAGWENHPRVRCLAGRQGIRETLALAQCMDCVIGPETGVLNAVAFEPMGKVMMLSHSGRENIGKHWANAEVLSPPTPCHPCHRLHYTRDHCPQHDATGTSQCAWDMKAGTVVAAVERIHAAWTQLRRAIAPKKEEATT